MATLDDKVMMVHIGTHDMFVPPGTPKWTKGYRPFGSVEHPKELELVQRFLQHRWKPRWVMGVTAKGCDKPAHFRDSPWGPVCMADGALSFENPRFAT